MENSQGRKKDKLSPIDNLCGHQYGPGKIIDNGYARCMWCTCRENTKESAMKCPKATIMNIDNKLSWTLNDY